MVTNDLVSMLRGVVAQLSDFRDNWPGHGPCTHANVESIERQFEVLASTLENSQKPRVELETADAIYQLSKALGTAGDAEGVEGMVKSLNIHAIGIKMWFTNRGLVIIGDHVGFPPRDPS